MFFLERKSKICYFNELTSIFVLYLFSVVGYPGTDEKGEVGNGSKDDTIKECWKKHIILILIWFEMTHVFHAGHMLHNFCPKFVFSKEWIMKKKRIILDSPYDE